GYKADERIISGYQILASRETPGLGTRVETDKAFRDNFTRLDVTLNASGDGLQHSIEVVKKGNKTKPWQIDTISGATISSRALGNIVAKSAEQWIPTIKQRLQDFKQ
ncbi:MAG: FMN-binding protein, partial [Gammaproteobacteria bacterium]